MSVFVGCLGSSGLPVTPLSLIRQWRTHVVVRQSPSLISLSGGRPSLFNSFIMLPVVAVVVDRLLLMFQ